ncbi:MAG: flavin reductase family protein [Pseudonocardiales bacterium]
MISGAGHNDDGAAFEALVGHLDYPMFVVTTALGERRSGCLVGFATQASIRPRRFLVGLSDKNHTFRVASDADRLAVHLLGKDDAGLARLFGEQTGDEVDKFAQCEWRPGPDGVPILTGAPAWFSGRILERLRLGDHVAFLIEPDSGECRDAVGHLVTYADVRDFDPGHEA